MKTPLLLTITFFFWNIAIHLAQPGSFDPDFNMGTGADFEVYTTTVQPDGKIFIGGAFLHYNESSNNRIARLLNDGTLDPEFITGTGPNNVVYASALQPDGKIIIGGEFTQYNGVGMNRIARLNPDGSLDNTFTPGQGANDRVNTISIQPDGRIIIGGYFTSFNGTSTSYIARLNEDGTLDANFMIGLGANNWVYETTLQTDGKIIVGGDFTSFNMIVANRIVRLNDNGSVDETFTTEIGASSGIRTITLQPDGKLIVGGNFTSYDGIDRNYVTRVNTNGTIDLSFNPGTGANNGVYTSVIQPDGKIIITGAFTSLDAIERNRIVRMNSDGSIDNSFDPGTGTDSWIIASALQSDGKLVFGGNFTTYNGEARNKLGRIITYCSSAISTDIVNACNAYTWIDGITYTENNNTATYTLPGAAANGCDSLITLQLTILNSANATDIVTACNAYTWIDGNTYAENNNTATYTLPGAAANGCDSLITLQLTILNSANATDIVTACHAYTWIDGITYTENNNTATYTLPGAAANGCDSLITLQLTIQSIDNTTTVSGNTITADATQASYQWLDCAANYAIIPGATSQSFTPTVSGDYAVHITLDTCSDTSQCQNMIISHLIENSPTDVMHIYPNPFSDRATIWLGSTQGNVAMHVVNSFGATVLQENINAPMTVLERQDLPAGIYFIQLKQESKIIATEKIVITE